MIKYKVFALAGILCLGSLLPAFSDTDTLLAPHSDMQVHQDVSDKRAMNLSDALSRIELISPQVRSQQEKVNQWLIKASMNPDEFVTPLTWTVTPWEVPAMMALEELRKITLGRLEKASIQVLNQAYALIEWDNLLIIKLNAKNDLKKLYVSSIINDSYVDTLQNNAAFFDSAYKDAQELESKHLILPSDLLRIQNYKNQIQRELKVKKVKQDIYNQDLGLLIDENKYSLIKDGAITEDLYAFDLSKLDEYISAHPEVRKNHDNLTMYRSKRLYNLMSQHITPTDYISVTIRRVVFEGPFLMLVHPSSETLMNLFKNTNDKQKKALRDSQIEQANQEIKASEQDMVIRAKNQYYQVQQSYSDLQQAKENLELNKRSFFEKQKLYEANKITLMDLVQTKVDLYQSELSYLSSLKDYNNSISDLQYYSGQYENGKDSSVPSIS